MNEDRKMFNIGIWALGVTMFIVVVVQVCYRTQDRVLNRVRADIMKTNQQIAIHETDIAEYVRPEVLRDRVTTNVRKAETIGFHKNITIGELADRK